MWRAGNFWQTWSANLLTASLSFLQRIDETIKESTGVTIYGVHGMSLRKYLALKLQGISVANKMLRNLEKYKVCGVNFWSKRRVVLFPMHYRCEFLYLRVDFLLPKIFLSQYVDDYFSEHCFSIMDVFLMVRRKKTTIFLDAKETTTVVSS